jgi:phage terminase large subunit-like protein
MSLQGSLATEVAAKISRDLAEAAEKSSIPSPVSWIEKNFLIPETRKDPDLRGHMVLQDYQRDAITEALSRGQDGNFKYSIIVWSDIKKSAKSTIAAAVNLYRANYSDFGEFYVIANDLKQANSRVSHYIRRAIQLSPKMKSGWHVQGYTITSPSGARIEAIPIDPSGEAGSNADQMTWSELWGANEKAKQNMWAEMTLSPTKYGQSFRWVESYAGWAEESELLYSLYEMGTRQGRMLWPDRLYPVIGGEPAPLELYVNEAAGMLCLWNTMPRCPWQTPQYYASEAQSLQPNQFQRIHRNQWVSSTDTFVPMEWWYSCGRRPDEWPNLPKDYPMIVALDAAVSGDCFGLTMGCRHPEQHDAVMFEYAQKWVPPKQGKIDYQGSEASPGPERVLRRLIGQYNVIEVAYDPYQLHDMATRLKQEHLAWFRPFSQQTERLIADSAFRDMIRDRRIWHRGEADLAEHINNADAQEDKEDRKLRIVKRAEKLKVDLAVCGSMMTRELMRLNL